jgi:hypothetical protein
MLIIQNGELMNKKLLVLATGVSLTLGAAFTTAQVWVDSAGMAVDDSQVNGQRANRSQSATRAPTKGLTMSQITYVPAPPPAEPEPEPEPEPVRNMVSEVCTYTGTPRQAISVGVRKYYRDSSNRKVYTTGCADDQRTMRLSATPQRVGNSFKFTYPSPLGGTMTVDSNISRISNSTSPSIVDVYTLSKGNVVKRTPSSICKGKQTGRRYTKNLEFSHENGRKTSGASCSKVNRRYGAGTYTLES